jgi:hypothetical protein
MVKKGPESEMVQKPTKTTVTLPSDLYGQMWQLVANSRSAGKKVTAQDIMLEALREYLAARKKEAAA